MEGHWMCLFEDHVVLAPSFFPSISWLPSPTLPHLPSIMLCPAIEQSQVTQSQLAKD